MFYYSLCYSDVMFNIYIYIHKYTYIKQYLYHIEYIILIRIFVTCIFSLIPLLYSHKIKKFDNLQRWKKYERLQSRLGTDETETQK